MPEQLTHAVNATNLADLLERVLDKGIVIAGDIKIQLADIDLLNIKIRLLIASVDKAMQMGINWWEQDPYLSTKAKKSILEKTQEKPVKRIGRAKPKLRIKPNKESTTNFPFNAK